MKTAVWPYTFRLKERGPRVGPQPKPFKREYKWQQIELQYNLKDKETIRQLRVQIVQLAKLSPSLAQWQIPARTEVVNPIIAIDRNA